MPILKSLSFTAVPKRTNDPVILRRAKVIGKLEEQLKLIKDGNYVRPQQRWQVVDGVKQPVTKHMRVSPWWRTDSTGATVFFIKYGMKAVEFEKGKAGVAVPSKDKLPTVIQNLIEAIRAGELDDSLTAAAGQRPFLKKKAA